MLVNVDIYSWRKLLFSFATLPQPPCQPHRCILLFYWRKWRKKNREICVRVVHSRWFFLERDLTLWHFRLFPHFSVVKWNWKVHNPPEPRNGPIFRLPTAPHWKEKFSFYSVCLRNNIKFSWAERRWVDIANENVFKSLIYTRKDATNARLLFIPLHARIIYNCLVASLSARP